LAGTAGGRSRSAAQGQSNRNASSKAQKRVEVADARQHISPVSVVKAQSTRRSNEEKNRKQQAVLDRKAESFQRNVSAKRPAPPVLSKKDKRSKKKQRDSAVAAQQKAEQPAPRHFGLDEAQLGQVDEWVQDNRGQPNKPPLTRDMVRQHIKDDYGITLRVDDVGLLLHHLHYEYVDPGAGYIDRKAKHPITIAHAKKLLPLMEYLEFSPEDYDMFYYDETTPHQNMFRASVWTKEQARAGEEERRDQSRKSGIGVGYMISGAVGASSGGFLRDEHGMHVGRMVWSVPKKGEKKDTETNATFTATICRALARLRGCASCHRTPLLSSMWTAPIFTARVSRRCITSVPLGSQRSSSRLHCAIQSTT
jgi:hypothetical protein